MGNDNGSASNLAMTQTFQEKMYERIKDQIGELLTPEDLKKLVDAAVKKAFFEPRITKDRYGYETKVEAPYIIEEIRKLLVEEVKTAIDQWMKDNPDAVTKAIDTTIAKGFHALVEQHIESKIHGALCNFASQLKSQGLIGG